MSEQSQNGIDFLQWALPRLDYQWEGFRKPREQVLSRIRDRMEELELTGGFSEYRTYLDKNPGEWQKLDLLCDVTISKFYRDRKTWEFLRDSLLSELLQRSDKPVICWSIGCCNGEEPYSLAMACTQLIEEWPDKGRIAILASDRNKDVLDRAREGIYPGGALQELTAEEIRNFFHEQKSTPDEYQIDDRLSECIEFEHRDIRDSLPNRIFDLVLCRNLVFTYYTEEQQQAFLDQLEYRIREGGYLVAGNNEDLPEADWLETASKTHSLYRRKA